MDLEKLITDIFNELLPDIKNLPYSSTGTINPCAWVFRGIERASLPLHLLPNLGPEVRSFIAETIRKIDKEIGVDAYVIVWEVFYLVRKVGITGPPPKDLRSLPDRQNGLMITAGNHQHSLIRLWHLQYEKNRIVDFIAQEMPDNSATAFSGRFADILKGG